LTKSWESQGSFILSFIPVYVGAAVAFICGVLMKVKLDLVVVFLDYTYVWVIETKGARRCGGSADVERMHKINLAWGLASR
jgi:hypothetical protein